MRRHDKSRALLIKQVTSHAGLLCQLLACNTATSVPSSLIERCAVATRMLAGTSSLMGLYAWELILTAYEGLLVRYKATGLAWEERIAQLTSELIEREEALVAAYGADPSISFEVVVSTEALAALAEEAKALLETVVQVAGDATPPEPAEGTPVEQDITATVTPEAPMHGVVSELDRVYQALVDELAQVASGPPQWSSDRIATIRSLLSFLDFYASSLDQMIARKEPTSPIKKCSLLPLTTVLSDFANEVSGSGENALDIVLKGERTQIDPRMLSPVGAILQQLINDTFQRTEGTALGVTVNASEERGAIRWRVTDNGNNFITDSPLDHEDQLAFYPGLKEVRRMLRRHHGVLWVEPRSEGEFRFEFTTPVTSSVDTFMVWGSGVEAFAVRSSQLCDLMPVDRAPRGQDAFGEFLAIDGKRVPLLRLDDLFNEAPGGGNSVAMIGYLEKRVAFHVEGDGELVEGKTLEDVVPVWHGPSQLVAQVADRRIALLDADKVLKGFFDLTGGLNAEEVSGGVVDDESELSRCQATVDSIAQTPPDQISNREDVDDVEVLVVEQSESVRATLSDIFRSRQIGVAFAAGVDEALELIHSSPPRVIISEFRMPTMAAKVLVEALGEEGDSVPVLVTTSQSGKTADLLVEKLGVDGFLSKPLDHDEVVSRVGRYLAEGARS